MKHLILITLIGLVLFSCKKKDDSITSDISVTNLTINDESINPAEEAEAHAGDNLKIYVSYESALPATQLRFSIHNNFDGHQHEHARLLVEEEKDTLFYDQVFILEENEKTVTVYNNVIPENTAEGEYHLEIIILNEEGGRAEEIYALHIHEEGEHQEHEHKEGESAHKKHNHGDGEHEE